MASPIQSDILLAAALGYAARGWRVIPLWWPTETGDTPKCACPRGAHCGRDGRNIGKHPILDDWTIVGTTSPEAIQKWWHTWPSANIGLLTGGGLVNLDIDPRNGGDISLEELQATYEELPETVMAQTGGGGEHRLFATTADLPSVKLAPGIDFLADSHHQFVAVPSLHQSGTRYTWELSSDPEDVPLALLPAWVAALVTSTATEQAAASALLPAQLPRTDDLDTLNISPRMRERIRTGVPQGKRSDALWSVLKTLIRAGYDDATIAGIVLDPANGISEKPLEQKNSRSPRYWEMTRGWVAKEIGRARAKPDKPWTPQGGRAVPMMTTNGHILPSSPSPDSPVLTMIAAQQPPAYWFATSTLQELHAYRYDPAQWGAIRATAKRQGIDPWDLDKAVDASPPEVDALLESLRFPFVNTGPSIPPLPQRARHDTTAWTTWLDDYAAHSAYWAPRAAPSYHQAVGLWVLSTIAARRIMVQVGSTSVYPTLFLALVSESTHWTKTTAASIGIRLLRRAGCGHLLAPDRTTPQFLLKLMSGLVPKNYGTLDDEAQTLAKDALGFAAQRGWFYEEWGGMLHQMRRVDSPHAELNKLLIVLEGGAETFETGTIQRGLERINNPYLALLGNATPHDLAPFMGEGNAWWHDGFWPRFVCVAPPYGATPSRAPRPREAYHLPSDLIMRVNGWHRRLGMPSVKVEEEREANGKLTGGWVGTVSPLPCQALTLSSDVYDAYETYNDALLEMVHTGNVPSDLSPWYGRAHEKALRVAMLLTSVHGESTITLPYWSEGQAMAETWRHSLHEALATIAETAPLSREAQLEAKIESLCAKTGGLTAREIQRYIKGSSSDVIQKALAGMVKIGNLVQSKAGKSTIYSILPNEHGEETE